MAFTLRRGSSASGPDDRGGARDGTMTLVEHLYELRKRLFRAVLAITAGFVVGLFLYPQIFDLLTEPFQTTIDRLAREEGLEATLTMTGVADPFTMQLKTALVSGIVMSSPVWLYQIWAFVTPGLHRNERKWSVLFMAIAGPLFIGGVAVGFFVLPKGLGILLDFTPQDVSNLVEVSRYLSFILRMLLVFGVAFEIPLFVVLLNLAGVVSGRALGEHRAWIILGTFVFAAVATPSTDPISMLFLAVPMALLFLVSEGIARLVDRRRVRSEDNYGQYADDETSPLEPAEPLDPDEP